jgi:hypothetical protein
MSAINYDDVPNWRERELEDENGYPVGAIADIYIDDVTGHPEWAVVKTGLFGHKVTFVPLARAALHGLRVQVPYAQAHIHDAPNIEPHGRLTADEEARLYQHYGLDYAPAGPSGAEGDAGPTGEGDGLRLRRHEASEQDADRAGGE